MDKTDDKAVGRESDKFMLRFPDGMRRRIAEIAKENGRSMNAEIVARLEQSFDQTAGSEVELGAKSLNAIEAKVRRAMRIK